MCVYAGVCVFTHSHILVSMKWKTAQPERESSPLTQVTSHDYLQKSPGTEKFHVHLYIETFDCWRLFLKSNQTVSGGERVGGERRKGFVKFFTLSVGIVWIYFFRSMYSFNKFKKGRKHSNFKSSCLKSSILCFLSCLPNGDFYIIISTYLKKDVASPSVF